MIRQFNEADLFYLVWTTRWTILLSFMAFVGGGVLGLIVAFARVSPLAPLRWATAGYIQLFEGTPLLIQLFLALFLPAAFDIDINPLLAAAIGLSVNASAFLGEIWRGGIESVPRGQWEASRALGLHRFATVQLVILPQAVRISIPPTVGYLVQLIKATSLASVIGFTELTRASQLLVNATYRPFFIFCLAAGIYFALCWPLSKASRQLERRMTARGH